jgi:hypothetical protein
MRVWTTITVLPSQRAAVIESHDTNGNWLGASRIEVRFPYRLHPGAADKATQDREALYDLGYYRAEHNAAAHGGTLERYGWA